MYLPSRFHQKNENEILELIRANPLATMVSLQDGQPFVSHLPLVLDSGGERLVGHMAKANPQWNQLDGAAVTAIFHGPQAYITPNWYAQNDVPTWNYAVVHIKGLVRLIPDFEGTIQALKILTQQMEKDAAKPWQFWLPEDLDSPESLTSAIVGFEIQIQDIQAKFKLSQNRSEQDRKNVVQGLEEERTDPASHQVANLMKRLCF